MMYDTFPIRLVSCDKELLGGRARGQEGSYRATKMRVVPVQVIQHDGLMPWSREAQYEDTCRYNASGLIPKSCPRRGSTASLCQLCRVACHSGDELPGHDSCFMPWWVQMEPRPVLPRLNQLIESRWLARPARRKPQQHNIPTRCCVGHFVSLVHTPPAMSFCKRLSTTDDVITAIFVQ